MGHGASQEPKCKRTTQPGVDYPVQPSYPIQPPPQPPVNPPGYNEPLHVPVSFYPDNVYSTSTGNGVIAQINRDLDNFDYRMTEALDGNRYFNKVHDPSIPPAPGMVQMAVMTTPPMAQPQYSTPSSSNCNPNPQLPPPSYQEKGPLP